MCGEKKVTQEGDPKPSHTNHNRVVIQSEPAGNAKESSTPASLKGICKKKLLKRVLNTIHCQLR